MEIEVQDADGSDNATDKDSNNKSMQNTNYSDANANLSSKKTDVEAQNTNKNINNQDTQNTSKNYIEKYHFTYPSRVQYNQVLVMGYSADATKIKPDSKIFYL